MWYNDTAWLAYWDAFSRPATPAQARRRRARHLVVGRGQGEEDWALEHAASRSAGGHASEASSALETARSQGSLASALRSCAMTLRSIAARSDEVAAHARLYPAPPAADDPDHLRHHAGLVRDRAVRAGRAGRARDRAIAGRRRGLTARSAAAAARSAPGRWRTPAATFPRAIAARRGSTRNSSRSWRSNTASTSRRWSGSGMLVARLLDLQSRPQLLSRRAGDRADQARSCRCRCRSACG